jgi:hypothetical protein
MKIFIVLLMLPFAAVAADDGRVSFLEQEVRNLHRQVDALSRQVDQMRSRPERIKPSVNESNPALPAATDWIDAAKWKRLRPGMSEREVIAILGTPTSMREEQGARVLLYALEIGSSGFLGGSVTLRDRTVAEVRQPVLQ